MAANASCYDMEYSATYGAANNSVEGQQPVNTERLLARFNVRIAKLERSVQMGRRVARLLQNRVDNLESKATNEFGQRPTLPKTSSRLAHCTTSSGMLQTDDLEDLQEAMFTTSFSNEDVGERCYGAFGHVGDRYNACHPSQSRVQPTETTHESRSASSVGEVCRSLVADSSESSSYSSASRSVSPIRRGSDILTSLGRSRYRQIDLASTIYRLVTRNPISLPSKRWIPSRGAIREYII